MQQNIAWYQINPYYFQQILEKQNLLSNSTLDNSERLSLFNTIKYYLQKIQDTGCQGIWLMPTYIKGEVNRKGQIGSPYAIQDYQISSEWGTEEDIKNLKLLAEELGLKLISEYVPNHLAPDAHFLTEEDTAYINTYNNSLYHDQNWTDTVKLNHSNIKVQAFTSANLSWLIKHYGFDGFRLDMAHYPMYGVSNPAVKGNGQSNFWERVFSNEFFQDNQFYWLAEVYDDKTQDLYGYHDHLRLINNNMVAYDKKTHDILANTLKYQDHHESINHKIYREIYIQAQITKEADLDYITHCPFLRIPSNHDDAPGLKIYNGIQEYLTAWATLAMLPGHIMLYAGEEFGLTIKPSVTGETYYTESGECTETTDIQFIQDTESQLVIQNTIKKLLHLRQNEETLQTGQLIFFDLETVNQDSAKNELITYARYNSNSQELIIVCINTSKHNENWVNINNSLELLDQDTKLSRQELFSAVFGENYSNNKYELKNLLNNQIFTSEYNCTEDLWVGLKPLESQIIKIVQSPDTTS